MEYRVQDLIVLAVQHHQAGSVPRVSGFLCDQFFRQVIPEIFFQHDFSSFFTLKRYYLDILSGAYYNESKHRGAKCISTGFFIPCQGRKRERVLRRRGCAARIFLGPQPNRCGTVTPQNGVLRCVICNMILYCILCRFSSRFFYYLCKIPFRLHRYWEGFVKGRF